MRVRAILIGTKFIVTPDPVNVLVGEPVFWEFVSDLPIYNILWEIYFQGGEPFGQGLSNLKANTIGAHSTPLGAVGPIARPTHLGLSPSAVASKPGDYKYGIRAMDMDSNQLLGDDDPYLMVLP